MINCKAAKRIAKEIMPIDEYVQWVDHLNEIQNAQQNAALAASKREQSSEFAAIRQELIACRDRKYAKLIAAGHSHNAAAKAINAFVKSNRWDTGDLESLQAALKRFKAAF